MAKGSEWKQTTTYGNVLYSFPWPFAKHVLLCLTFCKFKNEPSGRLGLSSFKKGYRSTERLNKVLD